VGEWMGHLLDAQTGKVSRWYLPASHSLNFLLENALGGGGVASLRIDPQGKAFAQQLLEFPVPVPKALADSLYQGQQQWHTTQSSSPACLPGRPSWSPAAAAALAAALPTSWPLWAPTWCWSGASRKSWRRPAPRSPKTAAAPASRFATFVMKKP